MAEIKLPVYIMNSFIIFHFYQEFFTYTCTLLILWTYKNQHYKLIKNMFNNFNLAKNADN